MLLSPEELVQQIHDSPTRIVLAATGGGSRAIADLLEVPGGSRTLLEAVVPYSAPAMTAWLGGSPDEFCSAATARAMAAVAFQRARRYEESEAMPAGVACTASLATDRPKRGEHRVHAALQTAAMTAAWRLQLHKDRRTRAEEERLVGRLLLNVVAEACQLAERLHLDLLEGERVEESRTEAPPAWQDLLLGKVECVCINGPHPNPLPAGEGTSLLSPRPLGEGLGVRAESSPRPLGEGPGVRASEASEIANCKLSSSNPQSPIPNPSSASPHPNPLPAGEGTFAETIFPGAFNPLHAGHRRMMEIAQEMLHQPAACEISIENVDKPPLDYMEIERRLGQFAPDQTVYLTRAATFVEKARLFAGATFIVGVDTLRRIAAPQYYGGNVSDCACAIQRIAGCGCRFLVFGRDLGAGFVRLGDVNLPDRLRALCREVPPEVFREDVSSTALRQSGAW
jgi:nicotinamide mononucleotide (NMN) deamidase PncC